MGRCERGGAIRVRVCVCVCAAAGGCRRAMLTDHDRGGVLVLLAELVVGGLHRLAVPSPRRKELDERALARVEHELVEVRLGQLNGACMCANDEAEHESGVHTCAACERVPVSGRRARLRAASAAPRFGPGVTSATREGTRVAQG